MAKIGDFQYDSSEWDATCVARRDFRNCAGGPEVPKHRPKSRKRHRSKQGCPENDGGGHVYEWVKHVEAIAWWGGRKYTSYSKQCIGCGKVARHGYGQAPVEVYATIEEVV